jgi:hypothetical protein
MRNALLKGSAEGRVYIGLSMWLLACAHFYYGLGYARGYADASSSAVVTSSGYHIPLFLSDLFVQVPTWLFFIVLILQFNRKVFGPHLNVRRLDMVMNIVIPISGILVALSFAF